MPIEYDIIQDKGMVIAKGSGTITGAEVLRHLEALSQDPRYCAPMKKLIDYRAIEKIEINTEEAWAIAEKKKQLGTKFKAEKCAFVSPGDLTFATSRVHQALVDGCGFNMEVFRSIEEAIRWLDAALEQDL